MRVVQGCGKVSPHPEGCVKGMILDILLLTSPMSATYERICGLVKAYQKESINVFSVERNSVDGQYVDGMSITLGSPCKQVCTYASDHSDTVSYASI